MLRNHKYIWELSFIQVVICQIKLDAFTLGANDGMAIRSKIFEPVPEPTEILGSLAAAEILLASRKLRKRYKAI